MELTEEMLAVFHSWDFSKWKQVYNRAATNEAAIIC